MSCRGGSRTIRYMKSESDSMKFESTWLLAFETTIDQEDQYASGRDCFVL